MRGLLSLSLFAALQMLIHMAVCQGAVQNDPWTSSFFHDRSSELSQDQGVLDISDIRPSHRRIHIVTTASVPWLTGTAINPLLRAAYLTRERPAGAITLVIPFVDIQDQEKIFPHGLTFNTPEEQRAYVHDWLVKAGLGTEADNLNIMFYYGRYHPEYGSVFAMGDIVSLIRDEDADVCVLEEPEHLNWYRATGSGWTDKFKYVVGVVHTNYLSYSRRQRGGVIKEPLLFLVNQWMCRSYCHKIIKLSGTLQTLAPEKEEICNVHGVRPTFLSASSQPQLSYSKSAYFVGKMLWNKGFTELFPLLKYVKTHTGTCFDMDIYGGGPDLAEISAAAQMGEYPLHFKGPIDHSLLREYRVMINPSLSEVLCTTVAEALAMGKWVVVARHPSNEFFERFPNCLTFRTPEEFAANVHWALTHDPVPLPSHLSHALSWEAATDRFISACMITKEAHSHALTKWDRLLRNFHKMVGGGRRGDVLRLLLGAGPVAGQDEFIRTYNTADPQAVIASTHAHTQTEKPDGDDDIQTILKTADL